MDVTKIISWLPFNESVTQDLLGGTWTAVGSLAVEDGALALESSSTRNYIYTTPPELGMSDFTIDWWEYIPASVNSFTGQMLGIDGTTGSNTRCLALTYLKSSAPSMDLGRGTGASWSFDGKSIGTKIRDQWVHRAVVRSGNSIYAFENGTLFTSVSFSDSISVSGSSLFIGNFARENRQFVGKLKHVRIHVGAALWTANFTPPTAENYADWQLAVAGYAPVKIAFDVETYLRNAQKGWRVYNPGEAELLATDGATTVEVPYTQSVTGKAFYGGTLSDMFHTPDGLKEIWIRFDFSVRGDHDAVQRVGHWSNSSNTVFGLGSNHYWNGSYWVEEIAFNGETILMPERNQLYQCLLHIISDATDGLVELTIDKEIHTWTGNINGGNDLNNLVVLSQHSDMQFSNVVVSETELTLDDGWHRDSFGVETKIHAPVLNVRLQGSNVKFPLSTKRKANSLTIRVGDKNFYNTSVATGSSLAGAARYLLDDEARALSTATT